ncbi:MULTISPECIES: Rieske 2Fe-2S domain-containing protein [Caballeronia]|uniref:aromatic ring-hydroxylating oxygenase subunit alpha n=1 Tax=Caballeronia TaxID=1827195 RepID=UPI001FD23E78|nr:MULTISPECIES: Rieske 2Fe-2S domain-containing protein [Caballeronia]
MEKGCTHFEGGSAGSPVRFVRNAQSVDAATLRQLVQPGRVHSAVYTSPDIFEAEIERIFHGSWLYVGHASEVPQKGDYRVRRLGRQPVIMVRGHDDVVRVLMNRCRHRGAAVCEQEAGREKVFRCWFHGWTYDNTGKLINVTDPAGYGDDFPMEEYSLTSAPRVEIYRDFVFASLSPEVGSLAEYLGPAAQMIDLLVDASPTRQIKLSAGVHKTVYNGNWKMVGMDGYHPHYVHASVVSMWQRQADSGIGATHRADPFDGKAKTYTRDLGNGHAMLDMREHRVEHYADYEAYLKGVQGGAEYIEALAARDGAEQSKLLVAIAGDPHIGVFPNMQIINNQVRIMIPLEPGRTEVLMFPVLFDGVDDAINTMRLRQHESFYGPAGAGSPDDAEIFERAQRGMNAQVNPWIDISRGMTREQTHADGTITGHISDEVPQRGQMRYWLELMTKGAELE